MTEAQEMAAFVTARLGEWEAAAKVAAADCPAPWRGDDYGDLADASGTLIVDGVDYGGAAWPPRKTTSRHGARPACAARWRPDVSCLAEVDKLAGDTGWDDAIMFAVKIRAAVFSDHPDYEEEWKP